MTRWILPSLALVATSESVFSERSSEVTRLERSRAEALAVSSRDGVAFNPDGSVDTTSGDGGTVKFETLPFDVGGMAVQSNGGIILAGGSRRGSTSSFAVARFTPDGRLDMSFGSGSPTPGVAFVDVGDPFARAGSVVIQNDGKLVVSGYLGTVPNLSAVLVRMLP